MAAGTAEGTNVTEAPRTDEERLAAYLATKIPAAEDLRVTALNRNVGGMSRETWFADTVWEEDGERRTWTFTVRADHPDGAVVPVELEYEYRVYEALAGSEVPIAAARWFEPDPSWIGRPFYIRDTIEGSSAPRQLFAAGEEDMRREIGRQLADLLARIHTLDWESRSFGSFMPVPRTAEECARLELTRWREHYEQHRIEARPVATELYSWLDRNAPTDVARTSLVWGDVGLGNFIFRDDRIVGLTDWEQAHIGDPMKDWASALYRGVDNLLPRAELFAAYEEASGIEIDEERIHYYTVFIDAQYVSISHPMVRRIAELDGRIDISLARLAMGFPFHCQHDGLRAIGY
jgi:aminoglycoside phosphotransferase (APT) family kinase protein